MSEFVSELSALMKKHKAFFYIYPHSIENLYTTEHVCSILARQDGFPAEAYDDGNSNELAVFITRDDLITPEILCDANKCARNFLSQEEI